MSETKTQPTSVTEPKGGFFKRLFAKVDKAMKEKAEKQSQESCCCSSDEKDKGGKCC